MGQPPFLLEKSMEPLKAGDLAIVIKGARGEESKNVGKIVTVGKTLGEWPLFGRMVYIVGYQLVQLDGKVVSECIIPVKWLKKIEPPKVNNEKVKERETEVH